MGCHGFTLKEKKKQELFNKYIQSFAYLLSLLLSAILFRFWTSLSTVTLSSSHLKTGLCLQIETVYLRNLFNNSTSFRKVVWEPDGQLALFHFFNHFFSSEDWRARRARTKRTIPSLSSIQTTIYLRCEGHLLSPPFCTCGPLWIHMYIVLSPWCLQNSTNLAFYVLNSQ